MLWAYYFSPTTPGNASWTESVASNIRLGSVVGLSGEARLGSTGVGSQTFDDPVGTFGHASDGIVGLKQMYFNELACPAGNQRLWTGYIGPRTYRRGQSDSLITGVARKIDVTLIDVNDFLSFRVFAPTADDPTSDFVRPAETDLARVQALLTTVDFLSTTLFDIGYIPSTGGIDMSANDYTGQRPIDVLNDCAQVSGRNFWVKYHEATNQLVLWYDKWTTDGSSTLVYDSALRLTNVETEHDGTTTFAIQPDAVGTLDPSRLVSAGYFNGDGVTSYQTRVATSYTYAWRDMVTTQPYIKDQAKLDAAGQRYLTDNSTENNTISCTVQVPNSKVTGIHEGMRIEVHFTHIPDVQSGFTWCRILSRTIRQDQETPEYYWLDLELSPIPPVIEPFLILYRPGTRKTAGTSSSCGQNIYKDIGWQCSGDPQPCSIASYGVQPTVGPLYPTPETFACSPSGTCLYRGVTFTGTGTVDFTSGYTVFTSVNGLICSVDVMLNGSVVATGSCTTPTKAITVDMTGLAVVAGDILTARFYHDNDGHSSAPYWCVYVDAVNKNFTITGGALVP